MLTVIVILSGITIFVGGLTKNPFTSPFSFIFFEDSMFVAGKHFYFTLYESFFDFYVPIHKYVLNYLKLILFIIPFVAIYLATCELFYFDRYHTYNNAYMTLAFEYRPLSDLKNYSIYVFTVETFYFTQVYLRKFFEFKSGADQIYNKFLVKPLLYFSYFICYKELDRGWLEYFLVKLPTFFCFFLAKLLNQIFGSL